MARVRLQDVADRAGVSLKTVSNVVNNHPHLRPEMRAKVEEAIKALGYRPNLTARRLATGLTNTIAFAVSDISIPYYAELAWKINQESEKQGFKVVVMQTGDSLAGEREVLDRQSTGLFDGLIFSPGRITPAELAKHCEGHPCIVLGESETPSSVDHVFIDNHEAARQATQHLIDHGRTKLAFLGYEANGITTTSMLRLRGYRAALEQSGLTADPNREIAMISSRPEPAADALKHALELGLEIDGIVCRDDLPAIGAIEALNALGIRVPQDVAVTGWDDITPARYARVPLTTIRPDTTEIATLAVSRLVNRLNGDSSPGATISVPFELVVRDSTFPST